MLDITIAKHELAQLLEENEQLKKQRDELQARMSEMVNNTLARRVRAFHVKFGHPVEHTPRVPDDATVRFRLKLITEEFFELLAAAINQNSDEEFGEFDSIAEAHGALQADVDEYVRLAPISVNLPEFYDAQLDLAYVNEGTHAAFGTLAEPGMAEVQRANLAKDPVLDANGCPMSGTKPTKPPAWVPPNIESVLRRQGWQG